VQKEIRISIKAVLLGGAADLFLTFLLVSVLSTYVIMRNDLQELRPEILGPQVFNIIHKNPALFAIQVAVGLMSSILGGYIAARIAQQSEIENAVAASMIFVAFGVYSVIAGNSDAVWLNAFSTVITPFFYHLGAQARIKQLAKKDV